MGNTVTKKATNINEFKQVVFNTNSMINSRNKQDYDSNIYITLSIDIPNNEIVTETLLWKLLVNVLILVYNKTNDGNYKGQKPIIKSSLTFGQFYVFLKEIQAFFEREGNKDNNNNSSSNSRQSKTVTLGLDEDDKLCPICFDNEATNVSSECFHAFCDQCVTDWRSRSNECPICRGNNQDKSGDFILIEQDIKNDPFLDYINSILVFIKK